MLDKIAKYIVEKAIEPDPKRFIKGLIKKHLKGYHLAHNPTNKKTKRTNGAAII